MPELGPNVYTPRFFSTLREIVRTLSTAWDLDTALDLIARKTTEVMQVDCCTIYLLDPDGESLRLQATTGLARRALGRSTLRVGEGMTGYAVLHNQPIFAADAQQDPHFKWVDEAEETMFTSLLAVPLVIEDRPIGALNVQTIDAHHYTEDEVEALSLIGDLAASTLVRARLYDKQRRQIEELRTLAQVSEAVTSPQYLDDILDVVTEMASQVMNAAECDIFLLDETGRHLVRHTSNPGGVAAVIALEEGILGQVVTSGKPRTLRDVSADGHFEDAQLAAQAGYVSLLAVPLSVRDRVIGVLCCYTAVPHTFTEPQRILLATLANQTALAIENTQLITNTAIVREMHHRIKNNLQTVAMLMQMQIYDADRLDTRQVLETNISRIRSIAAVHEVLSERGFRLVNVRDVLERIVRTTVGSMTRPGLTVDIHVYGESIQLPSRAATALALVVNELVQNALEHAFDGRSQGQINVSLGRSPDEFIILVRDDGIGLPSDYVPNLGLEIAETLVGEDLHGRLKFNRLQLGTEASIRLPRSIEQDRH